MRGLLVLLAIIAAVDVAWIFIDGQSFLELGWIVVSLLGFAAGLTAPKWFD